MKRLAEENITITHFLSPTGRFGRVIIISKDENSNLLRRAVWDELRQLDSIIQNATVQYEGESFTYHEACARWEGECFTNDILNLDFIIDDVSMGCRGGQGIL